MPENIRIEFWVVWRRADKQYIAHYTSFDDIPDEYVDNDEEYAIINNARYIDVSYDWPKKLTRY